MKEPKKDEKSLQEKKQVIENEFKKGKNTQVLKGFGLSSPEKIHQAKNEALCDFLYENLHSNFSSFFKTEKPVILESWKLVASSHSEKLPMKPKEKNFYSEEFIVVSFAFPSEETPVVHVKWQESLIVQHKIKRTPASERVPVSFVVNVSIYNCFITKTNVKIESKSL